MIGVELRVIEPLVTRTVVWEPRMSARECENRPGCVWGQHRSSEVEDAPGPRAEAQELGILDVGDQNARPRQPSLESRHDLIVGCAATSQVERTRSAAMAVLPEGDLYAEFLASQSDRRGEGAGPDVIATAGIEAVRHPRRMAQELDQTEILVVTAVRDEKQPTAVGIHAEYLA